MLSAALADCYREERELGQGGIARESHRPDPRFQVLMARARADRAGMNAA